MSTRRRRSARSRSGSPAAGTPWRSCGERVPTSCSPRSRSRSRSPPITTGREPARSQLAESFGEDQPTGGFDQRKMRERLREVAQVVTGLAVELLAVQTERRRDADQPLQKVARALLLADIARAETSQNEQ